MKRESREASALLSKVAAVCAAVAMSSVPVFAAFAPANAFAAGVGQEIKKPTVASLTARRDRILKARDAILALAAAPPPRELTPDQLKHHAALVAQLKEVAGGCDALAAKLTQGLAATNPDVGGLSDLSDTESLRLQMAMDRQSQFLASISNVLKKTSDTASSIISNMK